MSDPKKEQRIARMAELKTAMEYMVRRTIPDVSPDIKVEITPDAILDMFEEGFLDAPDAEWKDFIDGMLDATASPVDEDEIEPEVRAELEQRLSDLRRRRNS